MSSVDITNYIPFLAVLFGGGAGVTLIAQLLKKVFKAEEPHVVHILVVAVSVVAAAAQYVVQFKGKLPVDVLGVSATTIYGVSQLVYKESGYVNNFLAKVYGQPVATTVDKVAEEVKQTAGDAGKVMSGVEAVAQDAKAVAAEFPA